MMCCKSLIFLIYAWIFNRVQNCDPLYTYPQSSSLAGGLCVHTFQRISFQKMREQYNLSLGTVLCLPNGAEYSGCAALWRIFSSNKSVPANRKKGYKPPAEEWGDWRQFCILVWTCRRINRSEFIPPFDPTLKLPLTPVQDLWIRLLVTSQLTTQNLHKA
jgi:hypothetical protein